MPTIWWSLLTKHFRMVFSTRVCWNTSLSLLHSAFFCGSFFFLLCCHFKAHASVMNSPSSTGAVRGLFLHGALRRCSQRRSQQLAPCLHSRLSSRRSSNRHCVLNLREGVARRDFEFCDGCNHVLDPQVARLQCSLTKPLRRFLILLCSETVASWQHCTDYNTVSAGRCKLGATPAAEASGQMPLSTNEEKRVTAKNSVTWVIMSFPQAVHRPPGTVHFWQKRSNKK